MDDVLEAFTVICQGRGCNSREQMAWCPAWNVWLCVNCRWHRNESALRISLEDRAAMATEAAVS